MKRSVIVVVFAAVAACGGKAKAKAPVANVPPPAEPKAEADLKPIPEEGAAEQPADAKVTVSPEVEAVAKDMIAMLGDMAAVVDGSPGDCPKIAAGFDRVMAANQPFINKMKAHKGDADYEKQMSIWAQDHMGDLMEPAMKIGEAAQKCASDPTFAATMKRMEQLQ